MAARAQSASTSGGRQAGRASAVADGGAMHTFDKSNAAGLAGESRVLAHLESTGWTIRRVGMDDGQRDGVDAVGTDPEGVEHRIEVKADAIAQRTHRAAIETVSNDVSGRPGWVHTSKADFILYLVEGDDVLYWLRPAALRGRLPEWQRRAERGAGNFRTFAAPNRGYRTLGVLVPLAALEDVAVRVDSL